MIKRRIDKLKFELKYAQDNYNNLVNDIKKTFYEKDFWLEDSKRKPKSDFAKMQAAYSLLKEESPKYNFELRINRAEDCDTKKPLNYFYIYDEHFRSFGTLSPVICVFKRNIKELKEICHKAWIKEVSKRYDYVTDSFEDWLNNISNDDLLKLLVCNKKIFLVTDRKLYLKDIVIILPKKIENFTN